MMRRVPRTFMPALIRRVLRWSRATDVTNSPVAIGSAGSQPTLLATTPTRFRSTAGTAASGGRGSGIPPLTMLSTPVGAAHSCTVPAAPAAPAAQGSADTSGAGLHQPASWAWWRMLATVMGFGTSLKLVH